MRPRIELEVSFKDEKSKKLLEQLLNTNEGADIVLHGCHMSAYGVDFTTTNHTGKISLSMFANDFDWEKPKS